MTETTTEPVADLTIQVRGVTKKFGPTTAVDDVSFDVRKGEVVGFLGPNGSGKTTTMRLLTSFYTPDSGTILIDGIDNQEHDVLTRRKIGYLPENNPLYGDLLVHEYLAFVAELRGLSGAERRANIQDAVEETGIEEIYYRPINQCSKGYKQRVGLAQAILHHPEILIMDEPTEGLDPNQRVSIREAIRSIGKLRTVLLSTHVLQEVEATCDRLLIIRRGKIVAEGTADELRSLGRRERYVDVEIEGDGVEAALRRLPSVESLVSRRIVNGRQHYVLTVADEGDVRPEIFQLAKEKDWVLWELHENLARLEDLFHTLTAEEATPERDPQVPDAPEAEQDEED
jgi:ABC-2 type transport system ATP-binding protein